MNSTTEGIWEERPYGWKKKITENSQLIRIKPHYNTGMSATYETKGPFSLKINNARWEHVEFVGYADSAENKDFPLRYVSLSLYHTKNDKPREMLFNPGARFYSVLPDKKRTGYYHNLYNLSNNIIELRTEWEDYQGIE